MALSIVRGTVEDVDSLEPLWVGVHRAHAAAMPELAPYVSDAETWEIATGRRSHLLAGGELAQGEPADFLLLRADSPQLSLGDFTAGLVYAASGEVVDTTVVDGRVLMRGGAVEGEDEVLARALERARRLGLG